MIREALKNETQRDDVLLVSVPDNEGIDKVMAGFA
jgi:hypothetical protein